jgi:crossover junction endodeoxyribonuclease RusA
MRDSRRCRMEFELPYPPSVNQYWRRFRGRMVLSKAAQAYRKAVAAAVLEHWGYSRRKPIAAGVAIRLTVHPPDRRRRDLDNVLKAVLDAVVKAGIMEDDSQVERLSLAWGTVDPTSGGRVVMRLRVLSGTHTAKQVTGRGNDTSSGA